MSTEPQNRSAADIFEEKTALASDVLKVKNDLLGSVDAEGQAEKIEQLNALTSRLEALDIAHEKAFALENAEKMIKKLSEQPNRTAPVHVANYGHFAKVDSNTGRVLNGVGMDSEDLSEVRASYEYRKAFEAFCGARGKIENIRSQNHRDILERYGKPEGADVNEIFVPFRKDMTISTTTNGSNAIAPDFRFDVITGRTVQPVMTRLCNVLTTTVTSITLPRNDDTNSDTRYGTSFRPVKGASTYNGETPNTTLNNKETGPFGQLVIPINTGTMWLDASADFLADAPGMARYIQTEASKAFAATVDDEVPNGVAANGQAAGFLGCSSIAITKTGTNNTLVPTKIVDAFYAFRSSYSTNVAWVLARGTHGKLINLLDANNRPLFLPSIEGGLVQGANAQILGAPAYYNEFMPASGASLAKSIVVGDFNEYFLAMRQGYTIMVDDVSQQYRNRIRFTMKYRFGGAVRDHRAFNIIHESA